MIATSRKKVRKKLVGRELILATLLCCAFLLPSRAVQAQTSATSSNTAVNGAKALTVSRIYSYPSLSGQALIDAVWSPDGKWLTYLDEAGADGPEVWAVDATTGRRRVLVDANHLRQVLLPPASRGQQTGLGRITPPRYLWAPNSQAILFISAKELFWYELQTQKSKKLVAAPPKASEDDASIDDAKISPDGRWVSFIRAHNLWAVTVAGDPARALTNGGT